MNKIAYAGAPPRHVTAPASNPKYQRRGRAIEVIESYKGRLSKNAYAVLVASTTMDYVTIQERLNIKTKGTVKSRLNRARDALDLLIAKDREAAKIEAPTCP